MKLQNYRQVAGVEAAPGVTMRVVAGPAEQAPTFVMRVFEIEPGNGTPLHSHPWEHEVFVLSGSGELHSTDGRKPLAEGDTVTVLPGEEHSFNGTGADTFRVICVVPLVDGRMPGMPVSD